MSSQSDEHDKSVENATQLLYMMMAVDGQGRPRSGLESVTVDETGGVTISLDRPRSGEDANSHGQEDSEVPLPAPEPVTEPINTTTPPFDWSELEPLQYTPLPKDGATVRLLKVKRSNSLLDPIECELVDMSLDQKPDFAGLSYVWGTPVFDHNIICNGKKVAVTQTLHYALERYREDMNWFRKEYIWADALCINQKDKDELASQVMLMRRIYSEAAVVHINLGEIVDAWATGWHLMHSLSYIQKELDENGEQLHGQELWERCKQNGIPETLETAWAIYAYLYSLPWFFRTWIVQEIALAARAVVTFGKFHFEWDELVRSYRLMTRLRQSRRIPACEARVQGILNLNKILSLSETAKRESTNATYLYIMILGRDFDASDPRDKITGLHGVVHENTYQGLPPFQPDYTIPVDTLYHRFAIHLADRDMAQPMLNFAGLHRRGPALQSTDAPSWVPDWTGQAVNRTSRVAATIRPEPYDASYGRAPGIKLASPGPEVDPDIMWAKGIHFDKIIDLTDTLRPSEGEQAPDERDGVRFPSWYPQARTVLNGLERRDAQATVRYGDIRDAFIRTLLMNDTYTGGNAIPGISPLLSLKETMGQLLKFFAVPDDDFSQSPSDASSEGDQSTGVRDPLDTMKMQVLTACGYRKFAVTEKGYMGLVPHCAKVGDTLAVILGAAIPFVLRKSGEFVFSNSAQSRTVWALVGDSYVHGVMDGEIVRQDGSEVEEIWIR